MTSRKQARKPTRKVNANKAILAYIRFGSVRKAAKVVGCSHRTLWWYLKEAGFKLAPKGGGYRKGKRAPYVETSRIAAWYRRHRDIATALRSASKIAFAVGTTTNAVKCYLYRNRKYARWRARVLLDRMDVNVTMWVVDPYTFEVTFWAGDREVLRATIEEIEYAVGVLQSEEDREGNRRAGA